MQTADVRPRRNGDNIEIVLPIGDERVQLALSIDAARTLASLLMIEAATAQQPGTDSIFEGPQMLALFAPTTGVRRLPSGNVAIAIQPAGLLPILVEYPRELATHLNDALAAAVGEPPEPDFVGFSDAEEPPTPWV